MVPWLSTFSFRFIGIQRSFMVLGDRSSYRSMVMFVFLDFMLLRDFIEPSNYLRLGFFKDDLKTRLEISFIVAVRFLIQ